MLFLLCCSYYVVPIMLFLLFLVIAGSINHFNHLSSFAQICPQPGPDIGADDWISGHRAKLFVTQSLNPLNSLSNGHQFIT
jgi:uncharacterized membrane protein